MRKIIILTLSVLILGCGASEEEKIAQNLAVNKELARQLTATTLISFFSQDLKTELMSGIKEGGFTNAINVCQLKAPEIAARYLTENWEMKRVTDKPRNPINQANFHEQEILSLFATNPTKYKFFDEWQDPENKKDYYFYKPIYIGKVCLKCHGTKPAIDEKAVLAIQEKYPDDKAINYTKGDLRGMFVVRLKSDENIKKELRDLIDSLQQK